MRVAFGTWRSIEIQRFPIRVRSRLPNATRPASVCQLETRSDTRNTFVCAMGHGALRHASVADPEIIP